MLKKQQRLTKKEFDVYFKKGARKHADVMQLIYTPNETFHGAVVVGKKISKKAVDRNKFRRRIYAALYALTKEASLVGVYIIIAKPPIKHLSYSEIKEQLSKLIKSV